MWQLVLISLAAAPPRSPMEAPAIGLVPALSEVGTLLPFFEKAGTRSVLARPEGWKFDGHPLLEVDVTNAEALTKAGIDAKGPLTRAQVGDATMGCVRLINVDAYRKGCDARLARTGDVFEKIENGISIYGSRDPIGRVMVAYTVSGKESCAVNGHGRSVEALLPMLSKVTAKPASGPVFTLAAKAPGALQVLVPGTTRFGVMTLTGREYELTVDGRSKGAPFAQFQGGGPSPVGVLRSEGMAVLRGRVNKAQLPSLVDEVMRVIPGGAALKPFAREVSTLLTGNTALILSHVKVSAGLRTREARFFALKGALLAEVSDVPAVEAVLARIDPALLKSAQGTLSLSVERGVLIIANDGDAKARAVSALASSTGKQAHGLEFDVDPRAVAAGLQKVPLLEAVQAQELAALVAASSELGPLLLASERVTGWVDSSGEGQHTGKLVWKLDAAKFQPDAGQTDAGVK